MAVTEQAYTGNGSTTNYSFTFPYLKSTDIQVQVDAAVTTAWSLANATTVQFNSAPANGAAIKILRDTNVDNLTATFYAGSAIKSEDLNDNFTQNLYVTQEVGNRSFENTGLSTMIGNLSMGEDTKIIFEGATDNAHEPTLTVTDPTADRTITLPNVTGTVVTTGDTATVTATMLAADSVDSSELVDGSIDTSHISSGAVTTAKLGSDAVTGAKIADDAIDSEHYTDGSIDNAHIADDAIDSEHYADGSIDTAHIADSQITSAKIADGTIVNADVNAAAAIAHTKLAAVPDGQVIVGNGSTVPTAVALSGDVTLANSGAVTIQADTITIGKLGAKEVSADGLTDTDLKVPTSAAVVDYVAAQLLPFGGFEAIADEDNFPTSQPASGVVISIKDATGVTVDGSGSSATARTAGNGSDNVTINGFPSSMNSAAVPASTGLLVTSTGSSHTYTFHRLLPTTDDVRQLSDDVNDFFARYRIASSAPGSNNDAGDLYFNTSTNKMNVYGSSWGEVTSTGEFKILVLTNQNTTDAPTYNGSIVAYDLKEGSTSGSAASVTTAAQLVVSVNGVIQKPNAGTNPSGLDGFVVSAADEITFCAGPPSGADVFVIQCGSAVSIPTPGDDTVTSAKIVDGAILNADINASAAIAGSKLADDSIAEVKLDIHAAPSGTNKFLGYTSNGMEWAVPPDTNTQLTLVDEDNMSSNSATSVPSQQSVKAYADTMLPLAGGTITGPLVINDSVQVEILATTSSSNSITLDMGAACHHSITLAENTTFQDPSNEVVGQSGSIIITQDGTGSRTAAWNSAFKWAGGTAPTLSTAAAAVDRIDYLVVAAGNIHAVASLAIA